EAEEGAEEGGAIPAKENPPKKTFSFQDSTELSLPSKYNNLIRLAQTTHLLVLCSEGSLKIRHRY
ncbi:hypothetical protein ACJX0J_013031, partial [Zea mays]